MKKAYQAIFLVLFFLAIAPQVFAISTFTKYSQNPIVHSGENPNILFEDNIYKMWFTANYGQGWRINYAYSPNGISNWVIPAQSIISPGTQDGFELDMANPYVFHNISLGYYQMWYSSIGHNWSGGPDRFRIGYATSPDGINWTKVGWALKGTSGSWDSGGPARGASILFKNGMYQMWYAGTNDGFNWKIGYATSTDGLNWTKENSGQPVIIPTETWELVNVEYPNVILNNNLYEMFYGAGVGDNSSQIVYATSTDGINWTKAPLNNPILVGTTTYDGITITSPFAMRLNNGTTLLWYAGNVNTINIALDGPIPTPSVTPSVTPTPSPSPSPTQTPTPTPTPQSKKKIIIIPGIGGSWNRSALLNCSTESSDSDWSQSVNYYSNLRDRLKLDGLETYIFAYDWRKPVQENGLKLKQFIDFRTEPNEKVFVVGHSMGGLVARSYIIHEGNQNKVEKLLTVGTPHSGATVAYPAVASGEHWSDDIIMKVPFTLMLYTCLHYKKTTSAQTIRTIIPSFYDLLPVYDYLIDIRHGNPIPYASQFFKNNWIPQAQFEFPFFGVQVGALSGIGSQTHKSYLTIPPSGINRLFNMWTDGYPVKINKDVSGDGTVLLTSAYLPGAENWSIEANHGELVTGSMGIQDISEFFTSTQNGLIARMAKSPRNRKAPRNTTTTALAVVSDSGTFTVKTPKHINVSDVDGLVLLENPADGKYEIQVIPVKEKTTVYVGQIVENGKTIWKDYELKKKNRITLQVHFDHVHPHLDPFKGRD